MLETPQSNKQTCSICSTTRGLAEQLAEVALAARLLENVTLFENEHGCVEIKTSTIGDWFRLASQLESVNIDAWKLEPSVDDAFYCDPAAEQINAHGKHYTDYATALTRFIFVCNGLEEAYRYIDHCYLSVATELHMVKKDYKKTPSLRAVRVLDDLINRRGVSALPINFTHHCDNFVHLFDRYKIVHKAKVTGIGSGEEALPSYALQLLRNLRNHVAHGTFPLGSPAEYGGYEDSEDLMLLLRHACRIAGLYVQIILRWFSPGFMSEDYKNMSNANGEEFDHFLKNCTMDYILNLHQTCDFALHKGLYSRH